MEWLKAIIRGILVRVLFIPTVTFSVLTVIFILYIFIKVAN